MNIEIITTGDEVMQGVIVDTNTAWIAERAFALGHEIRRHLTARDDIDDIAELLEEASGRADAVIVSGGLGPTADDLTIDAFAKAFGVKLIKNEDVLKAIREFSGRRGRPMSPSNEKEAQIPKGATVLPNKVGTAPGIQVKFGKTEFFFLPGVPKELYQIFNDSVMPWLAGRAKGAMAEKVLRSFGMPEAEIDDQLKGVDLFGARLSFRVKFPEVLLKVVARTEDAQSARGLADRAAVNIRERLGQIVYGEGETVLAEVVGKELAKRKMTIAVAESCTGGALSNEFTNTPGSSEYFERGIVSYSNRSKEEILGVTPETLRAHGAVSRETAMAMAEGVRRTSGASLGIGVTGIAGPGGGTPEKPLGTVHIAIADGGETLSYEYNLNRDRLWFKQLVAWTAMDIVRKYLARQET